MKRILKMALLSVVLFGLGFSTFSQDYVQMMRNPNANFYDVQQTFNTYWEGKKIEKGKGYKAFRRWEAYMAPRVYPTGNMTLPSLSYENYLAWEAQQTGHGSGTTKSLAGNWALMGPVGKPTGGGAGRVNFIRFDPTISTTMYVGTPDGGLWKTTNGGTSWTTNTDQLTVIGCTDIAIDPTNTQIMYLATGDGDAGDSFSVGVLKSTDGGATWNTTGLNWTASQGRTISRLLIHPTNPQIIMAFGSNGIWRTTNGGTNWTQPTGTFNGVMDAEYKPGDPNTVYAAGTVFKKSIDAGVTWTTVATGLTGIGRLAIAVTPADPTYVYVLAARGTDAGFLGLIRSTNSGTSFTTRMASTATNNILGWDDGSDSGGQGWYDLAIAASPTNAEEVMTGGINTWRSTNGGTSFILNSHWFGGYSKPYVHADIHDLIYLPGSGTTVFSGNDGGIFKTTSSGTTWFDISSNLAIAQQYRVGLSTSNATLLVTGHQDNGTNKMNGATWTEIYGGDGMDCFIDRTNNTIIYGSYVYGEYYRSTNSGTSWTSINTGLPAGDWLCAWHQDPVTATTLYAGGRAALYKTTNSGTAWTAMGTPTGTGNIVEFVIAPSNNQIIYAIKSGTNAVSKSTNGGTSFTAVSTGLPTTASPTGITVSNTDPNIVFVTYSGYSTTTKVYKSINGGTSWTNISTGLPGIPVNCIVYQNGAANDAVYIGTDIGVYYKDNTSAWISFNTGFPKVSVRDLEIYYATSRLRAATFGRGTWDSDLYTSVPAVPVASFTASSTTICVGQSVTFTNTSTGLPTSYLWNFAGGTPTTSTATDPTVTYSSVGTYTVDLTATNASGSNTNTQTNYITVLSNTGTALPLTEGFTSTTFVPTNWTSVNLDLSPTTWARSATVGLAPTAGNSMVFDNFLYNDAGNTDEVRTPKLSFTGVASAQMTFDVAYAPYDAANFDGLEVLVSSDCGLNYVSVYSKSNTVLATGPATTTSFIPVASQWRTETINLDSYVGQTGVIVAFRNLAGYGNNLYVDNINITGVAAPVAPVASFTSTPATGVCTGQTVQYTSTSTGSPTSYSWTFQGGTPPTSTLQNPTVTYATAGTYNVALTATNTQGSNTSTQNAYISVGTTPPTPGTISGTGTVCSGTTGLTYSVVAVAGATSYTWTVPAGASITAGQGTLSATISMGTTSGNISVTANNSCGSSVAATFAVTVNATPATPGAIGGTTAICSGSTGNIYSISAVSGATSYTWSIPAGATITAGQGTNSATVTFGATSGNVSVTATNSCGTSAAAAIGITINSIPATPGSVSGTGSVCSATAGNIYSIAAVAGASSYTWTVPSGSTITAGQGTNSATVTIGSTSGNITVTASNSCGTSAAATFSLTVNSIPAAPGSISGNATVCSSSAGNSYSIAPVAGATSYTWTVPSGSTITSGQGTNSATVTTGSTSGNITVTANNSCGTSTAGTFVVTVNSAPVTPGAISGTTTICSATAGNNYSITPVAGATSYTWTVPSGSSITAGQGTNSAAITAGNNSGNITVTATNSCGTSASSNFALTINSTPAAPASITGSAIACGSSPGNTYSIAAVSGATNYTWTVPSGSTITSGQGSTSATITFGATSGDVTVNASNACGTSSATVFTVTLNSAAPATPGLISGTASLCENTANNTYTISAVSGATNYTWTVPAGSTIDAGQGTTSITLSAGTVGGTITVDASSSCGTSGLSSFSLTINPIPTVTQDPLADVCVYSPVFVLSAGNPAGGAYSGTGVTSNNFDPAISGTGTFPIVYTVTQSGCSNTATVNLTVDACAGLEGLATDLFIIYPNPTENALTVEGEGLLNYENMQLIDASGRLVAEWSLNTTQIHVNVAAYARGVYTLRFTGNQEQTIRRIQFN